jgi:hypothetical protein
MNEIVEITRGEHVNEYDGKTYLEATVIIKRTCGYGILEFNPPLEVRIIMLKEGEDTAYVSYDFGMDDRVSVAKEKNCLYNYSNDNEAADPILTALSTIKYDLEHAFNHIDIDPNYNHTHWALRAELWDRVTAWDWYEIEEYAKETQLEFDFS